MNTALLLLASGGFAHAAPPPVADVRTPPGFSTYLYSDQRLANDVYTLTIDDEGRVLVAGRGYVRVLVDDDGDGRADRAIDLIDGLKDGPMGLLAEGDSLYVVSDGGLKRYRGYNGRDKLTHPPETLLAAKASGEHDAHAVRRGPDGWLYLLCGNGAGIDRSKITSPRSPVKDPVAGSLVRISPDGTQVEVVADGFRNAYGFDFNADGEAFTFDSDNERCVGLPWYEGCRFYHVIPGGNYGWRSPQLSQTWRKPPYFADVVSPIADLGRGSPTGVACYRHTSFPPQFWGGCFLADWTFGRIFFAPLMPTGSTYVGTPQVFAASSGESGFAPTGLAVHPKTGELFVSIGGRGTRGGVYRIRCDDAIANPVPIPMAKRSLDWVDDERAKQWHVDALVGSPRVARRSLELLVRYSEKLPRDRKLTDSVVENLDSPDPLIRAVAGRLAVAGGVSDRGITNTQSRLTLALAWAKDQPDWSFDVALRVLEDPKATDEFKLQALRIVQIALGDLTARGAMGTVWEGYTFRERIPRDKAARLNATLDTLIPGLSRWIPGTKGRPLIEATRTLAALGEYETAADYLTALTTPKSPVRDDIHYLIVLARSRAWGNAASFVRIADSLLRLDTKAREQRVTRDSHWPLRLKELAAGLCTRFPQLGAAVLAHSEFGRPEHLIFVEPLQMDREDAARKFLVTAYDDPDYPWTPGVVALLGELRDAEYRGFLPQLWARGGLEESLIPLYARNPQPEDRPKLLVGLRSLDPEVIRVAAMALRKLPDAKDPAEIVAAIQALRRLPDDKSAAAARFAVTALLRARTGQKFGPDAKAWSDWFTKTYPDQAGKLAADGFDASTWDKRAAKIDWAAGDPDRGRKAFVKATCASCHDGGGAIGPPLQGVGKRFSRDDLLTAILQPSRDVSPRYRPTRITTTDGKAYVGMLVYDATDGVILQTGPDTTVRIPGGDIETRRTLDTSLMPAGLLDKLTDQEVSDLLAYLRALDDPKPPR
jgi:putative heme-binding domain-containing protein